MNIGTILLSFLGVLIFVIINVLILVWMERRVAGFFQERPGPNRVGPLGLLQTVNDVMKLLGKEAIIPKAADKAIFKLAPITIFMTCIALYAVLPFGKDLTVARPGLGLFYFISLSSTTTISILMAGWGSNNKYSLMGGMRAVAQIISYEIPIVLSMLGVVMISGSLNLTEIVGSQNSVWYILLQPLAFIIFLVSATAELNRAPFDMPEAEQELTGGFHTEYGGIRFALFFLSEYANLLSMSALGATLFLGGWQGPLLPGWIWFIMKVYVMIFIFMWVRWTFPRARLDHMMKFNWKLLIPLALVNILLTGVAVKALQYFHVIGG